MMQALEEHRKGNLQQASRLYHIEIGKSNCPAIVYQNYGALLRDQGDTDQAKSILELGRSKYLNDCGILTNLINTYRDIGLWTHVLKESLTFLDINTISELDQNFVWNLRVNILESLIALNLFTLARSLVIRWINYKIVPINQQSLYLLLRSCCLSLSNTDHQLNLAADPLIRLLEETIINLSPDKSESIMFGLSQIWYSVDNPERSLFWFNECIKRTTSTVKANKKLIIKDKFQSQIINHGWNLSILLLRHGFFKAGWHLYEYGLLVPAEGLQKWQRSLTKPLTAEECPVLRNLNDASGKTLLVLGEQGIGDTMMFALLIPYLYQDYGIKVYFMPGSRLFPIYTRHQKYFNTIKLEDINSYAPYDYQLPIGSLPNLLGLDLNKFGNYSNLLSSDSSLTKKIRDKYLSYSNKKYQRKSKTVLIGFSWQGGGRRKRIKDKSIDLQMLLKVLDMPSSSLVSLQYGDDKPHLDRIADTIKSPIIHDDLINPLKDMDSWLSQVDSVDIVVTIANTTVHAAAGLGKPTFCLLGPNPDWRWCNADVYSQYYWYPSVKVSRYHPVNGWSQALTDLSKWLTGTIKTL